MKEDWLDVMSNDDVEKFIIMSLKLKPFPSTSREHKSDAYTNKLSMELVLLDDERMPSHILLMDAFGGLMKSVYHVRDEKFDRGLTVDEVDMWRYMVAKANAGRTINGKTYEDCAREIDKQNSETLADIISEINVKTEASGFDHYNRELWDRTAEEIPRSCGCATTSPMCTPSAATSCCPRTMSASC